MLDEEADAVLTVDDRDERRAVHAGRDVANDHRLADLAEVEGDAMALRDVETVFLARGHTGHGFEDARERRAVHERDVSRARRPRQAFAYVACALLGLAAACGPMPRVHRAIDMGDYDDARERLTRALAESPNDRELLWWLVRVEMLDEEPAAARVVLRRLVAIDRTDVDAYIEIGIGYELERDYAHALEAYVEATERVPTSAKAFRWLGQRLMRWGQPAEAIAPLRKAIELDPSEVEAWGALGRALLLEGDAAGAEEVLRRAMVAHADDRDLVLALGLVLLSQQRWADALRVYDDVVARWPRFAPAHVGRGILLDTLDRRTEALHAFETAASIDPGERPRLDAYRRRLAERVRPRTPTAESAAASDQPGAPAVPERVDGPEPAAPMPTGTTEPTAPPEESP